MPEQLLRVDLARADDNDVVRVRLDRASDPAALEIGQFVLCADWEGNECWGVVERIDTDEGLVYVALLYSTWEEKPLTSAAPTFDLLQALFNRVAPSTLGERERLTGSTEVIK